MSEKTRFRRGAAKGSSNNYAVRDVDKDAGTGHNHSTNHSRGVADAIR